MGVNVDRIAPRCVPHIDNMVDLISCQSMWKSSTTNYHIIRCSKTLLIWAHCSRWSYVDEVALQWHQAMGSTVVSSRRTLALKSPLKGHYSINKREEWITISWKILFALRYTWLITKIAGNKVVRYGCIFRIMEWGSLFKKLLYARFFVMKSSKFLSKPRWMTLWVKFQAQKATVSISKNH